MGSPDLVAGWSELLEKKYNQKGAIYASNRGGSDLRFYLDIDDRTAGEILSQAGIKTGSATTITPTSTSLAPARHRRKRLR